MRGTEAKEDITKIAALNDEYRRSGQFQITSGVQCVCDARGLMQAVREYSDFTEANDPYDEHDFGSLLWCGEIVYWKIDYYAEAYESWQYPLSPDCRRILTILLASEY